MKIIACKVNHRMNPIGCYFGKPVFSWNIVENTGKVRESRVLVQNEKEIICDTGWKELDFKGTEIDIKLSPRTIYTWTVSVRTEDEEAVSEENAFETGKMDEPWTGKWITCTKQDRHPIFCKDVSIKKEVKEARLYICGLGLYEAYFNNQKIGDEYLTPYCNNYDNWLQAETYDVTEYLKESGTLEVHLGNGWYLGRFGFNPDSPFRYGKNNQLIAEVHITYADGDEEVIATDASWKVKRSHITFSNIYDGEHVDDTLEEMPVETCMLSEDMPAPVDQWSLPLTAHEIFKPDLIVSPKGEYIFDLKQNIAGIFTFKVHEPKGTVIRLQAGEVLQQECFYRDNLRTAKAEYVYVSDGEEHVLRPKFTFYGYRYMKVEGVTNPDPEDFRGIALYSDMEMISSLTTGNEKINQLISNSKWGMKGNFLDVPTDCPQRDERMGWTGDAQVFSATALYFADAYAFYQKYLHDMSMEQKAYDGLVPMVVPSFGMVGGNPMGSTATVWGDATTIIPWNMYQFTGDITVLKEHYPAMKSWIEYIRKTDGDTHHWREVFHFGDWLALDGADKPDAVMGGTDEAFIADVYFRKSALIVSQTAKLLGNEEDAQRYAALADKIKEGIMEAFYTPTGRCAVMTQTAQILSIENELGSKDMAAKILVKLLENNNRKLKTGFVGTPLLCDALTKIDRDDLAYDLLFNEEYPGWLYEVNLGATTIWERWNSVEADGSISSTGMNSLNHYSYGSIVQWIYERCAGLKPLEPGFSKVRIAPLPHAKLKNLDLCFASVAGEWKISWKLEGRKQFHLSVSVPYGCEAEIILPSWNKETTENEIFADVRDGICYMHAGTYEIDYALTSVLGILSVGSTVGELTANPEIEKMLIEKMPQAGPIPMRSAQGEIFLKFAQQYNTSPEVIEEIDREIERITE